METWPIFVAREMYNDGRPQLRRGSEIAWNVVLTDGAERDWPKDILIDVGRHRWTPGGRAPRRARPDRGLFALLAGRCSARITCRLRGLIVADWSTPLFQTTVSGRLQRLYLVTQCSAQQSKRICLTEISEQRGTLQAHRDERNELVLGLLAETDVASVAVSAFPPR